MTSRLALIIGIITVVFLGGLAAYNLPARHSVDDPSSHSVPSTSTPIDAAKLAGHEGLYYLDAGNLHGVVSTDSFSAYQDLQDEGQIGDLATILTDQNLSLIPSPQLGAGLRLVEGRIEATLGEQIDLSGFESINILPVSKGGTGLSIVPQPGALVIGTGTGYGFGSLHDGDGTTYINDSGQLRYSVDSTVCRTTGNCVGVGGGVLGPGSPNYLARFTSTSQLGDSLVYDNGSGIGIGTTNLTGMLTIEAKPASILPTNLISNGSFDTSASGWDLGGCGSYGGGQVTVTYSAACTGSGWPTISTTFVAKADQIYEISFDVVSSSGDIPYIYFDNMGYQGPYGMGHHTTQVRATVSGSETIYFESWDWNDDTGWSVDNVSIKEVNAAPAVTIRGIPNSLLPAMQVSGGLEVTGDSTFTGSQTIDGNVSVSYSDTTNAGYHSSQSNSLSIKPTADGSGYFQGLSFTSAVAYGNPYAVNAVHGIAGTASNNGTGAISALNGLHLYSTNYGDAPISYIRGQFLTASSSQGTISNLMGIELNSTATGGVVTNQKGLNLFMKSSGATVTNRHALYINAMSGVATNQDYAIYSAASQSSYLAGSIGLGTTSIGSKLTFAASTVATGGIQFGSDTNLYRSAADTLKTDDHFFIGGGVVIGTGGTEIKKHVSATKTWDPASVNTGAATSTTVTVTGASMGDTVTVGFSAGVPAGMAISGSVTSVNTVTVTIANLSGASVDLVSGTLRADVWQH